LADRLDGESPEFIGARHRLTLEYVVAIRSNHAVWRRGLAAARPTRAADPLAPL
jgi:SRSO17 transposase